VIVGFLGLLGWAARDQFVLRTPVTVVPVVVTRAEVHQEGMPLFQAAGWVEPRPTVANVAALTEGVVETLLVVEGQEVKRGEPVAKLVDVDAKFALREAETMLALRDAEAQSAEAELAAARLRVEHPAHLEAALADGESSLAKTETELAKLPFLVESAKARLSYAQQNLEGKRAAGGGVSGRLLTQAESSLAAAKAELEELEQREPHLRQEVESLRKKRTALAEQLALLIEESRQLAEAEAKLLSAKVRRDQAQIALEKAKLTLERTVVVSPLDGRVLRLVATPGARVMGLSRDAEQSSSTVVTLYDPTMLQVRADVRLEDVPLVQPGQPVEIETASSKEPLRGIVLLPTSAANIQKNTLEVKVAIVDPPATVRPEMLVTATFLAPRQAASSKEEDSQDAERLLVPRQLVESSGGEHSVWIVDALGNARRRSIRLGKAARGELIEVAEGLAPTDKLISSGRERLQDGDRVTVQGEDSSLGMTASQS
jgi:multidrug efflux pump subunit AcrA (membrane-fusion protein)